MKLQPCTAASSIAARQVCSSASERKTVPRHTRETRSGVRPSVAYSIAPTLPARGRLDGGASIDAVSLQRFAVEIETQTRRVRHKQTAILEADAVADQVVCAEPVADDVAG